MILSVAEAVQRTARLCETKTCDAINAIIRIVSS
jgi:hypothetical protein